MSDPSSRFVSESETSEAPEERIGDQDELSQPATKQRIVKVLSPAVRLWLKTQVKAVDDLQVEIQSGDRALLSGKIQQVGVTAREVVYQGLHLSFVTVTARDIQINIGQILRGKPLMLLAPVSVEGEAQIREDDLNASAESDLLSNALTEFLVTFMQVGLAKTGIAPFKLRSPKIKVGEGCVDLTGTFTSADQQEQQIGIQAHLSLPNPHILLFEKLAWLSDIPIRDRVPEVWDDFRIDLGEQVKLHQVNLTPGEINCRASLTIMP